MSRLGRALLLLSLIGGACAPARLPSPVAGQSPSTIPPAFAVDSHRGCKLWDATPKAGTTVAWSGACDGQGLATGQGVAEWHAANGVTKRCEVEYAEGKRNG